LFGACIGVLMGRHLCRGAAAMIREQAENIVVAHALTVSQRLGCGLLGYACHDFALIKWVGPSRSA
jgi:hypothetical protein